MSEYAMSATLKAGTGFEAPWLVVYGNSPDEINGKLESVIQGALLNNLVGASAMLQGVYASPPTSPPPVAPQAPQQAPVASQQGYQAAPRDAAAWQTNPPPQQAPQQQAPQQQYQQQQPAQSVPSGFAGQVCNLQGCGQPLEFKRTTTGRDVWRCPQWRWNNGAENGHRQEWP